MPWRRIVPCRRWCSPRPGLPGGGSPSGRPPTALRSSGPQRSTATVDYLPLPGDRRAGVPRAILDRQEVPMYSRLSTSLVAELIGTFALIFIGAGTGALSSHLGGIALAHGLVVVGFAYAY